MTTNIDEARLDRIENTLARIEERGIAHDHLHIAEERSRIEALAVLKKDLEDLNDVRTRFVDRREHQQALDAAEIRINALENWRSRSAGMAAVLVFIAGIMGAAVARVLVH
jgi:hypothetical protein